METMKTYEVLCKTCGGTGVVEFTRDTWTPNKQTSAVGEETCPVCKGTKTQIVHETSSGLIENKGIITT